MTVRLDMRRRKFVLKPTAELHPYAYNAKTNMIGLKEMASFLGLTQEQVKKALENPLSPPLRHVKINGEIRTMKADFGMWVRFMTVNEYHYIREPEPEPPAQASLPVDNAEAA